MISILGRRHMREAKKAYAISMRLFDRGLPNNASLWMKLYEEKKRDADSYRSIGKVRHHVEQVGHGDFGADAFRRVSADVLLRSTQRRITDDR